MRSPWVLFTAALAATVAWSAPSDVDVFLSSNRVTPLNRELPRDTAALVSTATITQTEPRFGVPTFVFAARDPHAPDLRLQGLTPEAVARRALFAWAPLYRLDPVALAEAPLLHVHDLGTGAVIVQFGQQLDGVRVFHQRLNVVLTQKLELVALSGALAPLPWVDHRFALSPESALAVAFEASYGLVTTDGAFRSSGFDFAGAQRFDASNLESHDVSLARTRRVLYPDVDQKQLVPAFHVELDAAPRGSTDAQMFSCVISALDGRVLSRHSLTANDAWDYKVWVDPVTLRPLDGPNGRATPHPTGLPDNTVLPFVAPVVVHVGNAGLSTNDDWLPSTATVTTGNNVEAYADLAAPDGFGAGDLRGTPTAPGAFTDLYDVSLDVAPATQRNAGITQLFYDVNWLHDAFYDKGFNEAAGNAQTSNFGRGGAENDSIKAESQDVGGLNNANMSTPDDGARPRMQMFVWQPPALATLTLQPGNLTPAVGTAAFGPSSFNLTANVVLANDGVGPTSDACSAITNNVTGAIVLVDRGTCTFESKAVRVQAAGGVGMILANNAAGGPPALGVDAAITTPPTIPSLSLTQTDGNALKTQLLGGPVSATMLRAAALLRDGSVDNTVVAHEWGHYLSHRLVPGLGSQQAAAMGEGWGDTVGMLLTVEASDASKPGNATFGGVYAMAIWDTDSNVVPTNAAYFGIRRAPYSVDFTKNALTFRHIGDGVALPTHPLATAAPANSEVHNAGEIWATALWEVYVALLRATPRLTFAQAQDRMYRYLVGSLKATPSDPTYLEARDAWLAVAAANDVADFQALAAAFARRGMGQAAIGPARSSTTLTGVVEDFGWGNEVATTSATLTDDDPQDFCDRDGVLDVGERGRLHVTVKNLGVGNLANLTATLSSTVSGVTFTPATVPVSALAPYQATSFDVAVRLPASVTARSALDVTVTLDDPSLRPATPRTRTFNYTTQQDVVASASTSDDFEASPLAWTFDNAVMTSAYNWSRAETDPLHHLAHGPDAAAQADLRLVSPPLDVGTGPFSFTYSNRWSFEYTAGGTPTAWDGAVLELSNNAGATWTDIGASASPGYGIALTSTSGNALGGRAAWVGDSAGQPAFITSTVNLGTTYAGQTVRVRFRISTDQASGKTGWDLDDIAFTGLTNRPFPTTGNHRGTCLNRPPIANAGPDLVADERTVVTLTSAASTDADGNTLTARWTQTAGPSATLTNGTFTAPEVSADTTLTFALVVNDGTLDSLAPDTVDVLVKQVNRAPVVSAGADATFEERASFQLVGTATDPNGDPLTLTWRQVSGPLALVGATNALTLQGAAPEVTADATLVFELAASDGTTSTTDQVSVSVKQVNRAPTVRAFADGFVDSGASVTLTGFVMDADGDATTQAWSQLAGPSVTLSSTTALSPTFTAPVVTSDTSLTFRLVASDGQAMSTPGEVTLVVRGQNAGPIARPGDDVTVASGGTVTLDGSGSSDPEGGPLTFAWVQEGDGSRLTFDDASAAKLVVHAPIVKAQERLSVTLYVRDAQGAVGNATVHVTVTPGTAGGCQCSGGGFEPAWLLGLFVLRLARRRK
ncbi:MAG: myxosortase-dependent M36 family metallopeptidase [Myxococcaceae bacterium]